MSLLLSFASQSAKKGRIYTGHTEKKDEERRFAEQKAGRRGLMSGVNSSKGDIKHGLL
jgi:hypothetical protein